MDLTIKGRSGGPWGFTWTGQNHLPRLPGPPSGRVGGERSATLRPQPSPNFCSGIKSLTSGPLHQLSLSLELPGPCPPPHLPDSSSLRFAEGSKVTSRKRPSLPLHDGILPAGPALLQVMAVSSFCFIYLSVYLFAHNYRYLMLTFCLFTFVSPVLELWHTWVLAQ